MKKAILAMAVASLLAANSFAAMAKKSAASAEKKTSFQVSAGVDMPMEDGYKMGFGFAGGLNYKMGPALGLLGELSYHTLGGDEIVPGVELESFNIIGVLAALKYTLGTSNTRPYLLGGLGFFNWSTSVVVPGFGTLIPATKVDVDGTDIGIAIGGGVDFGKFFAELRYMDVDGFGFLPINVGLKF
jgi:opacity protein-like surface antigen